MDTPRLRLILLASLRGLVKPDYKFRTNSLVREEMLLRAVAREEAGDNLSRQAILEGNLLTIANRASQPVVFHTANNLLFQSHALHMMIPPEKVKHITYKNQEKKDIKEQIAALKLLKKTDFFDKMARVLIEP